MSRLLLAVVLVAVALTATACDESQRAKFLCDIGHCPHVGSL